MNGVLAAGYFLFSLFFGLITFALWVRIILHFMRVSSLHPVNQVVLKITNPLLYPLNKVIPSNKYKRIDIPCLILVSLICLIKFTIIGPMFFVGLFSGGYIIAFTIADLIVQPLNLLFYAIVIRVIMSWINPSFRNPLVDLLIIITEPILSFFRKYIPEIAGFDFTPLAAVIAIKVITITIGGSLPLQILG